MEEMEMRVKLFFLILTVALAHLFCSTVLAFTEKGDGTVTDEKTGLTWQKVDDGKAYNWYMAAGVSDTKFNPGGASVCGDLRLAGYSDWRLPSKDELLTIVDSSIPEPGPTIDAAHFPGTRPTVYWSSTKGEGQPGAGFGVVFRSGNIFIGYKGSLWYVRCVRGGR
jgi:hypothetical protein